MKIRFDNFGTHICVNFSGLQCIPLNECTNVYGTKADHFARLGVVSPIQTNCLADSGTLYSTVFVLSYHHKNSLSMFTV